MNTQKTRYPLITILVVLTLAQGLALGFTACTFTPAGESLRMTVETRAEWIDALKEINNAGNYGSHVITIAGSFTVPAYQDLSYTFTKPRGISITLKGSGSLTAQGQGSVLNLIENQHLILDGAIIIQGNPGNTSPLITLSAKNGSYSSGGRFTIRRGNLTASRGNAVNLAENCKFTMEGGAITGNLGYGVYLHGENLAESEFTMEGGAISGNTKGGVYLDTNSAFTMYAGTISGHTVTGSGGAVYLGYYNTFTMEGGEISGNQATLNGGAVYVSGASVFTMNDGTIRANKAAKGAGVYIQGAQFTKRGGIINGNESATLSKDRNTAGADYAGHAVFCDNNGPNSPKHYYYRDTTLPDTTSGNISTTSPPVYGNLKNWDGTITQN